MQYTLYERMCQVFVPQKMHFYKHLFSLQLKDFGIELTRDWGKMERRDWGLRGLTISDSGIIFCTVHQRAVHDRAENIAENGGTR